jgi:endonuclease/exonuclease/phosphatase family metal-dependent hydrolase
MLVGPQGSGKSQWKHVFTGTGKWAWVHGEDWQENMKRALMFGSNVVVDRNNTNIYDRMKVYAVINEYNTEKMGSTVVINLQKNVAALVFHPSSGNGSSQWNQFIGVAQDNYLQLPVGEIERSYRVLDMDDGVTVHTHEKVLRAAADNDWDKVHILAESIVYGPVVRQFKEGGTVVPRILGTNMVSIMSYNILWQPASRSTWKDRMPTLLKALKQHSPDIVCMQEVGHDMYRDLEKQLTLYDSVLGITPTSSFGCATFFKIGVFGMSADTPPRAVLDKNKQHKKERVVAQLTKVKHTASQQELVVCNTHLLYGFDPYMDRMRKQAIQRIKKTMQHHDYKMLPQLLCGDFNSKAASVPLQEITTGGDFLDIYRALTCVDPEVTVEVSLTC